MTFFLNSRVFLFILFALIAIILGGSIIWNVWSLKARENRAINRYYSTLDQYKYFRKYATFESNHKRLYNAALDTIINCEITSEKLERISIFYHNRNRKGDFAHEANCENKIEVLEKIITFLQKYVTD